MTRSQSAAPALAGQCLDARDLVVLGDAGTHRVGLAVVRTCLLYTSEIRELLSEYDFPGDDTPIIRGSALKALEAPNDPSDPAYECIKELMDAVDTYIPNPDREEDKPFLMPIEDVMTLSLIHI